MSQKINVSDLFKKWSELYHFEEGKPEYLIDKEDFTAAIKEIVEAVIDKCAEEAKTKDLSTDPYEDNIVIDEESILNVKKLIDYE